MILPPFEPGNPKYENYLDALYNSLYPGWYDLHLAELISRDAIDMNDREVKDENNNQSNSEERTT